MERRSTAAQMHCASCANTRHCPSRHEQHVAAIDSFPTTGACWSPCYKIPRREAVRECPPTAKFCSRTQSLIGNGFLWNLETVYGAKMVAADHQRTAGCDRKPLFIVFIQIAAAPFVDPIGAP
jgi:hypothetical protein